MVEEQRQQVNDDDVSDSVRLGRLAAKVGGQLDSMRETMHEDGFSAAEALEALTQRFEKFVTEFRYQAALQFAKGGIPKMPEVP